MGKKILYYALSATQFSAIGREYLQTLGRVGVAGHQEIFTP